ncbi:MAG: tetratricopeptide repeat protein [bacterium]|nr:tetratricopeptide repeat protein [bacterium]
MRTAESARAVPLLAAAAVWAAGCAQTQRVTIERLAPPTADVSGITDIAVLPFHAEGAEEEWADEMTLQTLAVVVHTGRYRVMKAEQVRDLLGKAGIGRVARPDAATVRRIGNALDLDAVIFGELKKFQFEEESRLLTVRERVWTGEYVRDAAGVIVSDPDGRGGTAPRRRFEEREVEKNRLKRYAALEADFRMADAFLGNVICSSSESESGGWEATGDAEIAQLPTREAIFDLLADRAVKSFVRRIAAHPVEEERLLEVGMFHSTRLGVQLAKNNLWDEAVDKWLQATKAKPDDPAAYYNLGVAFERKRLIDLAYKSYQNALARNPHSKRYIKAVAAIQKLMKDLE